MRFIESDHRRSASRRSVRRDADPDQDLVVLGHGPLDLLDPEGLLLLAVIALGYRVPIEARTGQTIGKTLMGISVYGPDGSVPAWGRTALRNLIGVLVLLWPIDAVLLLRNRRRQRLGDLLTGTSVRRVAH